MQIQELLINRRIRKTSGFGDGGEPGDQAGGSRAVGQERVDRGEDCVRLKN